MTLFIVVVLCVIILISFLYSYNLFQFRKAESSYPPKGNFVTVDGVKLHYISKGKGKPVVFLHGGVLNCEDFNEVMEHAAEAGYHAVSFDRPGYGHSERPQGQDVTPITQAEQLHKRK